MNRCKLRVSPRASVLHALHSPVQLQRPTDHKVCWLDAPGFLCKDCPRRADSDRRAHARSLTRRRLGPGSTLSKATASLFSSEQTLRCLRSSENNLSSRTPDNERLQLPRFGGPGRLLPNKCPGRTSATVLPETANLYPCRLLRTVRAKSTLLLSTASRHGARFSPSRRDADVDQALRFWRSRLAHQFGTVGVVPIKPQVPGMRPSTGPPTLKHGPPKLS